LYLSYTRLGENVEDIKNLSDALKVNQTLTNLDLSFDGIYSGEGIKILSDTLKVNQTLTTLDLSRNLLGKNVEDIKNLSDALKVNQTLTTLDLYGNDLGENDLIGLSLRENLKIIT
jgi:Ran GTPase-activating protein (RanGAP) involved in mRNA processing and transport